MGGKNKNKIKEFLKRNSKFREESKNVKSNVYFGLVGFYGISTIVGYLMPNPLYTYILNIYDLVWLGFMAYGPL